MNLHRDNMCNYSQLFHEGNAIPWLYFVDAQKNNALNFFFLNSRIRQLPVPATFIDNSRLFVGRKSFVLFEMTILL
jgi:hypothetical protein